MEDNFDIKQRLAELQGSKGFYRPVQRVTFASTPISSACSVLNESGCVHCHATYGHRIGCATWGKEATLELNGFDEYWLKAMGIQVNSISLPE